jgi:hypothetical protein
MPNYYTTLQNDILGVVANAIDTSGAAAGTLRVYGGSVPADINDALTSVSPVPALLSEHTTSNPVESGITGGVLTFDAIGADSSANNGSSTAPTFVRWVNNGGTEVIQMTAGVSSGEVSFDGSITAGQQVQIGTGGIIEEGNG